MRIMMACGAEGLLEYRSAWRRLSCPLPCPTLLTPRSGAPVVVDESRHLLWTGDAVTPVDSGLEALMLWQNRALTLSGDTDCLTLLDLSTGQPLLLTPAGMYPQDLCFVGGNLVAVCGGADGMVRLFRLSDLKTVHEFHLPGATQRVAYSGSDLTVLCLMGDDGMQCLMCRIPLPGGIPQHICTMPGLPGALCPDGRGGVWMAVSERLAHFAHGEAAPDVLLSDFGLIRHMSRLGSSVLTSDPVLGQCALVSGAGRRQILYEGDVQQAVFAE